MKEAQLIVALDVENIQQARVLVNQCKDSVEWFKIGLELFVAAGAGFVEELKSSGLKVFLDLKFLDIPNTVKKAVYNATKLKVDILTLHLAGGKEMVHAAVVGRNEALIQNQIPPLLMGVTILTSMSSACINEILKTQIANSELSNFAVSLAKSGNIWGIDGVVCSGHEAREINATIGNHFKILTPGIRLPEDDINDQKRVITPKLAIENGSNFLVVGRPITKSSNPAQACERFLRAMNEACE